MENSEDTVQKDNPKNTLEKKMQSKTKLQKKKQHSEEHSKKDTSMQILGNGKRVQLGSRVTKKNVREIPVQIYVEKFHGILVDISNLVGS